MGLNILLMKKKILVLQDNQVLKVDLNREKRVV